MASLSHNRTNRTAFAQSGSRTVPPDRHRSCEKRGSW